MLKSIKSIVKKCEKCPKNSQNFVITIIIKEKTLEYRDLYDKNINLTGKIIAKDEKIPEGCYI